MATRLGGTGSLNRQSWLTFDLKRVEEDSITVVVQVNGKLRVDSRPQKVHRKKSWRRWPLQWSRCNLTWKERHPEGDRGA